MRVLAAIAAVVGVVVLTSLTWRARKIDREIEERVGDEQRYVDFGVDLYVVRQDLQRGKELMPGRPPMIALRRHRFGGLFDSRARRWVGPSVKPVRWFCSEEQEPLLLHDDALPPWLYFSSGFGAGKSTTGAMWAGLQVIRNAGRPQLGAGITSPTDKLLEELRKVILGSKGPLGERTGGLWPGSWFRWRERDGVAVMRTGLQIDFRTAGNPLAFQGANWPAFQLNDELQDYYELDSWLQARGRGGWHGRHPRFATVTPRDNPGYRTFRGLVEKSPDWHVVHVSAINSPFLWAEEFERRKRNMSQRRWEREVLGLDLPSEERVYHTWSRTDNLRPVPQVGALDVTRDVLARYGNYSVLVGHDPGAIVDYSVLLKAYRVPGQRRHVWWVVGELMTQRTTTEQHGRKLLELLRAEYGVHRLDLRGKPLDGSDLALIHADPHSDSGNDSVRPDRSVYVTLRNLGLHVRPAAYAKPKLTGSTIGAVTPGQVPKQAGIEMIVRLLCDADGERRLMVACNDQGPVAPELIRAFEQQEYDAAGKAETARKREGDTSHPVAALRYALARLELPKSEFDEGDERGLG